MDDWLSATGCDLLRPFCRRIASNISALVSNGNWSVAGSPAIRFLRRTATSRRLVGVEWLRGVAHVLLLRPVATSCRSTQGDMRVLASTYDRSRPTWVRLRLIASSCSTVAAERSRSGPSCAFASTISDRNTIWDWHIGLRSLHRPPIGSVETNS